MQLTLKEISANKSFGGWNKQFEHQSTKLNCAMRFAIYLPPEIDNGIKVPVLYWLSGLTCTDENFMHKAGAQQFAAKHGIAIVAPDTSPRGEQVADDDGYDLGQGAGFYLNATQKPWCEHYQMYDYIVHELPSLIEEHFLVSQKRAISGHSMGGHGALTIALKNSDRYVSASAFSPISNPVNCPWGQKAFAAYLGDDREIWAQHDASILLSQSINHVPCLIDQGLNDNFLEQQLKTEALAKAAQQHQYPLTLRFQDGYDHSYFFISSFIEEHVQFHDKYLKE